MMMGGWGQTRRGSPRFAMMDYAKTVREVMDDSRPLYSSCPHAMLIPCLCHAMPLLNASHATHGYPGQSRGNRARTSRKRKNNESALARSSLLARRIE